MNCGTVLRDQNYQFPNGNIGDKLVIVLCELGTDYLVFLTTSQAHGRSMVRGCHSADRFPSYFLPQNSCWFHENTWVVLDDVGEINAAIYDQKRKDNTIQEHSDVLLPSLMRDILDCALESDFIDGFYKEFLKNARDKL